MLASDRQTSVDDPTLRLGISACLLGEEVRFNGGHVKNDFLLNTLGEWVEWVPICPEVEIGLGVPRESLRLIGDWKKPRLVAPKSGNDHTEAMRRWSESYLERLDELCLDGFVLKKDSPSCGAFRVKVYDENTVPKRQGRGLFAAALIEAAPLLPIEEEGRLNDAHLRENFIERIFAFYRFKRLAADPTPAGLIDFHTRHKLTLMAHAPAGQRELGRLVADAGRRSLDALLPEYGAVLMQTLRKVARRPGHTNVLHHVMGFFKEHLDAADKQELLEVIETYRVGQVPLIVPITLLRHHLRRHPVHDWLPRQVYLDPYPSELALRNHV
ncbi:MAG: DUF523 and DUF1722 domain-containing protein [Thermoanaerobaculia bacterium]|nr:DUF523 and DUF1722 domain-containing protein [Thermoanaerobaculia bacterium]